MSDSWDDDPLPISRTGYHGFAIEPQREPRIFNMNQNTPSFLPAPPSNKIKILARNNHQAKPNNSSASRREKALSKSAQQREREYAAVRAQIFGHNNKLGGKTTGNSFGNGLNSKEGRRRRNKGKKKKNNRPYNANNISQYNANNISQYNANNIPMNNSQGGVRLIPNPSNARTGESPEILNALLTGNRRPITRPNFRRANNKLLADDPDFDRSAHLYLKRFDPGFGVSAQMSNMNFGTEETRGDYVKDNERNYNTEFPTLGEAKNMNKK